MAFAQQLKSTSTTGLEVSGRAPVLDYVFDNGLARNRDGGLPATVQNCTPETVSLPGETKPIAALRFGPTGAGSSVVIPQAAAALLAGDSYAVTLKIRPTGFGEDRMNLLEGQHPAFSLFLQKNNDAWAVTASINCTAGWVSATTGGKPIALNTWNEVGLIVTGDDLTILINSAVVARRVFRNLAQRPVGEGGIFMGTWVDRSRNQFIGQIAGLKIWSGVPSTYEPALVLAEQNGLGEIESKYNDLGGATGFLGGSTGVEQVIGTGRMRSYQGGTVYWSNETGTHEVHGAILATYNAAGGPAGRLGFPLTDEENGSVTNSRKNRFENGAIYWSPDTGARCVEGPILAHYLQLGAEAKFLGLPLADEQAAGSGRASEFQGGTIYWSKDSGPFEVHGLIRDLYRNQKGPDGFLGFPLSDESDVFFVSGQPTGGKLSRFQGGTIYWSPQTGAFEVHGPNRDLYEKMGGPISKLGFPITNETGIQASSLRYNDFQNGVIIWWPSNGARAITSLDLHLGLVRCGGIDDGPLDSSPELITYSSVWVNGTAVETEKRRPDGHAGDSYDINADFHIPVVRSNTTVRLQIKVSDWDQLTDNDHLGTIDRSFDMRSFWGMDNGMNGVYIDQPAIEKSGDLPKLDTLKFSFRLAPPSIYDSTHAFREQAWWQFHNPVTPTLDRVTYANTFRDVDVTTNWFQSWALNPFDSAFYELVYKKIAANGNCFGMSLEAAYALAGKSIFAEPLSAYGETPAVDSVINIKHGYQVGGESIRWIIGRLTNLDAVRPLNVFDAVCRLIDCGERPLISMFSLASFQGHTVLAYGYRKASTAGPNVILVADPNVPWSDTPGKPDPSRVECNANDTFRFVTNNDVPFQSETFAGGLLPKTLMIHTPFSILSSQPRTPFKEIVEGLALLLGGTLIIFGESDTAQLKADSQEFYAADRRIVAGAIPGMARIPLLDFGGGLPEVYAYTGKPPDSLEVNLSGRSNGRVSAQFRTARSAFAFDAPVTPGAQDRMNLATARSSRPIVSLETSETLKAAHCNYLVVRDSRGRDYRGYEVELQMVRGAVTRMAVAQRGTTLVLDNPGPAKPLQVRVRASSTQDPNLVSSIIPIAASPGSVVQITPQDPLSPHGNVVVQKLSSIGGAVLSTAIVQPVPETRRPG